MTLQEVLALKDQQVIDLVRARTPVEGCLVLMSEGGEIAAWFGRVQVHGLVSIQPRWSLCDFGSEPVRDSVTIEFYPSSGSTLTRVNIPARIFCVDGCFAFIIEPIAFIALLTFQQGLSRLFPLTFRTDAHNTRRGVG